MKLSINNRGYDRLEHDVYPPPSNGNSHVALAIQSSVVGEYEDALDRPGSSALWIGAYHHLSREEVQEFIGYLQRWVKTGKLRETTPPGIPIAGTPLDPFTGIVA